MVTANDLVECIDAMVWTKEWLRITKDNPAIATEFDAMIGWFSNAIMAGYDEGYRLGCKNEKQSLVSMLHTQET